MKNGIPNLYIRLYFVGSHRMRDQKAHKAIQIPFGKGMEQSSGEIRKLCASSEPIIVLTTVLHSRNVRQTQVARQQVEQICKICTTTRRQTKAKSQDCTVG